MSGSRPVTRTPLGSVRKGGVETFELPIRWGRLSDCRCIVQSQSNANLVDAVLEVEDPLRVPPSI